MPNACDVVRSHCTVVPLQGSAISHISFEIIYPEDMSSGSKTSSAPSAAALSTRISAWARFFAISLLTEEDCTAATFNTVLRFSVKRTDKYQYRKEACN